MSTIPKLTGTLVTILLLASCVWQGDYDELARQHRSLSATNNTLAQAATQKDQQIRALNEQLAQLEESKRAVKQLQLDTSRNTNRLEALLQSKNRNQTMAPRALKPSRQVIFFPSL